MFKSTGLRVVVGIIVVAVVAYLAYRWFAVATVSINSTPTGAVVSLDGRRIGSTPFQEDVAVGVHQIAVQHSYFRVHQERIDFAPGSRVSRDITLENGRGSLRLLSNPKGSWVEIDGERQQGVTPIRIDLAGGPHEVLMGQDERKEAGEIVEVVADSVTEVNLDLNIDPHGSLVFITQPANATVELVGTDLKYSPKMRLPIGEYGIRVSRPGYVTENFRFVVQYGDNLRSIDLKREYGVLRVNVVPKDADVRVTYADAGKKVSRAYVPAMRIPAGDVEVRARSMLRRTQFKEFRMSSQGYTVNFNLPPMDARAGGLIQDQLKIGGQGPSMVVVPAGSYVMGNEQGPPSERPAHRVTITQPFAMSRHEVTVSDYLKFAEATQRSVSAKLDKTDPQFPMHLVSWDDATAYAAWLSKQTSTRYRLPSEAEWEYAARAGSSHKYHFGDDVSVICEYANLADQSTKREFREWRVVGCDDGNVRLAPVGSLQANDFGLFDMAGNVSEWVLECGQPNYANAPNDGSVAKNRNCTSHGVRGGSWDSAPDELQSAYRNTANAPNQDRGIRLVKEL